MLKFGKGRIEVYGGTDGSYLKFWVTTIVEGFKGTHRFYVDPVEGTCGRTSLFYHPKCDMDCLLDPIEDVLYFTEFQPNYYL